MINGTLLNFGKRYKDNLKVIFDKWTKLHLGLDALSNQKILKGIQRIKTSPNISALQHNDPINFMNIQFEFPSQHCDKIGLQREKCLLKILKLVGWNWLVQLNVLVYRNQIIGLDFWAYKKGSKQANVKKQASLMSDCCLEN